MLTYLPEHWAPVTELESAQDWLEAQQADALRIVSNGESAGLMLIHKATGQWHIGFLLLPAFWGKGLATAALEEVQALSLSEQVPPTLFAGAAADNVASLRVLKKCGFTLTQNDDHVLAVWSPAIVSPQG